MPGRTVSRRERVETEDAEEQRSIGGISERSSSGENPGTHGLGVELVKADGLDVDDVRLWMVGTVE